MGATQTWTTAAIAHPVKPTHELTAENDSEEWNPRDEWSLPPHGDLWGAWAGRRCRAGESSRGRRLWIRGGGTPTWTRRLRVCTRSSHGPRRGLGLGGPRCHHHGPRVDAGFPLLCGNLLHRLAERVPRHQQRDFLGAFHHDISSSCWRYGMQNRKISQGETSITVLTQNSFSWMKMTLSIPIQSCTYFCLL